MNIILKILTVLFTKKANSGSLKDHSITIDFDKVEHINGKILKADEINGDSRKISIGRIVATGLTIGSAALLSMTQQSEGLKTTAYNDSGKVATIGIGTTQYRTGEKAGQKVKLGDTITKEQAYAELRAYYDEVGKQVVDSLKKPNGEYVALYQSEFDIILDFSYQYGIGAWKKSSIRQAYLDGDYIQACENYLKYKFVGKNDCSKANSGCRGVWLRSQKRRDDCLKAGDEKQG